MIGPLAAKLRIAWRLTAFVVVTCALWGAMELDILLSRRTPHIELINKWVPRWAGTLLWIFGVRVDARGPLVVGGQLAPGRGADGIGRIYVMNHRSSFDIPVVLTHVAAHAISRHDLASWPLIGPGARRIGTLFVDRASRRSGAEVLKQVDEAIDRGEGVAMFPEGTAFGGDEVREFRPGAFKAALRAGSEIVPMGVAYENPDCYYRDESFLDHVRRAASLRCMRVALEVGEPIGPSGLSAIELRDIAHARVVDLVSRARARIDARRSPVLYPTLLGQEQGRSKAPQAEGGGTSGSTANMPSAPAAKRP